jgi:dTMP kinase
MESKGAQYHRRVRQGYLDQAKQDPQRYFVIDARPDAQTVTEALVKAMAVRLSE